MGTNFGLLVSAPREVKENPPETRKPACVGFDGINRKNEDEKNRKKVKGKVERNKMSKFIYVDLLEDGFIYVGKTSDVDKREEEHRGGGSRAAAIFSNHP